MKNYDFDKYKNYLKDLLIRYGKDTSRNPMPCISPDHIDSKPSMLIYDDYFKCQSCNCNGDIYDAVGILESISKKADQYKFIDKIYGSGTNDDFLAKKKQEKKEFIIDKKAEKQVREYIVAQAQNNQEKITEYLKQRKCTESMIVDLYDMFGYWTGYKQAEKDLTKEVLFNAGIPGKNPKTGEYSWGSPGVVCKIGRGFKLFYYDGGQSVKIGTKQCLTFPFPCLPDSPDINICEGEMTAISMIWAGYTNTVAIGGVKALPEEKIKDLLQFDNIYIFFDGDKAGRENRELLKERLIKNGYTGNIYIVRLLDKQDPDDLIKFGKKNILDKLIEDSVKKDVEVKEVKKKLEEKKEVIQKETKPFRFAGFDDKYYYVIPQKMNIAIQIGQSDAQIKNMLLNIANLDWWMTMFPKDMENGGIILDKNAALEWFRTEAQKRGLYDYNKIRGVGAHFDKEDIIINTGKNIYSKKRKEYIDYDNYNGDYLYQRSRHFFDVTGEAWNIKQCHDLFVEILHYGFTRDIDYILLAGYIVLAPFATLLHRRPHIAVMGAKGVGKTAMIDNIVHPALGKTSIVADTQKTSEAGTRAAIGRDCINIIFDEFEAHSTDDYNKNKSLLGLARGAYGGSSDTLKSNSSQTLVAFKTKVMFFFAAINIIFDNDADRTRIPILKMKKSREKIGKTFDFSGLRKKTFDNIENVLKNIEDAKKYLMDSLMFDARMCDTYGTLIGGFWSLISEKEFLKGDEKINAYVAEATKEIKIDEDNNLSDEEILFDNILNHKIRIDSQTEKTISEMLFEINENDELINKSKPYYDVNLKQIGIRRDREMKINKTTYDAIAISVNNHYISEILKNTPYHRYKNILIRHPASIFEDTQSVRMLDQKKERCIILDFNKVKEIHYDIEESKNLFSGEDNPF
jgi:hypothetical protein